MPFDITKHPVPDILSRCSLLGLGTLRDTRVLLQIGEQFMGFAIKSDGISEITDTGINASWDFSFSVSDDEWSKFAADVPPCGFTSVGAIVATQGSNRIGGDRVRWASAVIILDRVFEALREAQVGPRKPGGKAPEERAGISPIEGRYVTFEVGGSLRRVYFEAAGDGPAIVCLHTAGSDSRQYRHLLEDRELTARYRLYAFDLPWHGRSDPPENWEQQRYALTTQAYADTILAFMQAIGITRPILVGCSIGGAISLYMASRHGDLFAGVAALEGGLGNPGRFIDWSNRLDVDHSAFMVSWERGLVAPSSPPGPRAQTLWQYAQGGPGVYQGDTYFYSVDFPKISGSLGRATCPLYILSGEYDYSATTEMSRHAAEKIGGELIVMKGRGHFPMSEDPIACGEYLYPVLDSILEASNGRA